MNAQKRSIYYSYVGEQSEFKSRRGLLPIFSVGEEEILKCLFIQSEEVTQQDKQALKGTNY